jgi:hypothetical protein
MGKASRRKRENREAEARHKVRMESDPGYAEFFRKVEDQALKVVRAELLAKEG